MPSQPPSREAGLRGTVSPSTLLAKWKMAWPPRRGCGVSRILMTEVGSAPHCELGISLWRDLFGLVVLWAISSMPTFVSHGVLKFHFIGRTKAVRDELNLAPTFVLRPQTPSILVTPHPRAVCLLDSPEFWEEYSFSCPYISAFSPRLVTCRLDSPPFTSS